MRKIWNFLKALYVWSAFAIGVAISGFVVFSEQLNEIGASNPSATQTHTFFGSDCGFAGKINTVNWRPLNKFENTYVPNESSLAGILKSEGQESVYLKFSKARRTHLTDPLAPLFDAKRCVAQDIGEEITASGLRVRLHSVECSEDPPQAALQPPGRHQLYGTFYGHWESMGAGLFAKDKEELAKYRPALTKILKTLEQRCPFEFSPLPTEEQAQKAAEKAGDEAAVRAAAAAGAAQEMFKDSKKNKP